MGDTEGSSDAAQGAPDEDDSSRGILTRWLSALSGSTDRTDEPGEGGMIAAGSGFPGGLSNLTRLRVEDVMIPKVEVVAVPVDISKDGLVEVFRESGMTRLPVFRETLDQPVGLVHLKDFALRHGFNGSGEKFQLGRMLRPLLYAPPSMPIGVLLQKMQTERLHMALVIDEYGGVDGLVTIEDLIEQVLGEIEDEHDVDEADLWTREGANVWLAQARTPVEDFEDAIGQKILIGDDEEEIDTLGGLVFMLAGRVPSRGEVIKHPDGLDFEVVDADPRRIKRLRVRLNMAKAAE